MSVSVHHYFHLAQDETAKLDKMVDILTYLKETNVNKQEFANAIETTTTALTGVSDQLTKALGEIVEAIANSGISTPAMDSALAKLQLVTAGLEGVSTSLDNLNVDAPA